MSTTTISDANFEADVLKSTKPVLVDFWAPWCGPCLQMAPVLDEVATSLNDKVTVAKLNIDDNPKTAKNYGVKGIPTFMIFKDGQVVATKVAAMPKSRFIEWVQSQV